MREELCDFLRSANCRAVKYSCNEMTCDPYPSVIFRNPHANLLRYSAL